MDYKKTAIRVTRISILSNTILSVFKLITGIVGHSTAMVSDAVHSFSDVFSSIIVEIGIRYSSKLPDDDHPYGHERFECVAALILSIVLAAVAFGIGFSSINRLNSDSKTLNVPGISALIAAIISILVKEFMYHYTKRYAKRLNSGALMADAWHHRSDALSSIGSLIGIAGAKLGMPILDPIAGLVISLFILKASFSIFTDAIRKMVDHSCDKKTQDAIENCIKEQSGVLSIDKLITREFGNRIYVDVEIGIDGDLTMKEGHDISETVHKAIETTFDSVKHITVHANPYQH